MLMVALLVNTTIIIVDIAIILIEYTVDIDYNNLNS